MQAVEGLLCALEAHQSGHLMQEDVLSVLQGPPGVVQLYRTPGLSQSASNKLLSEATAAGLPIVQGGLTTELVRNSSG